MDNIEQLKFILNLLTNNTKDIELYRERLREYCKGDIDFTMRLNNTLELLKIDLD